MKLKRKIDHIVYCVPNLEEGIDHFEHLLGIRPVIGGRHLSHGTQNALLNLGNSIYFEILSVDDSNLEFNKERWMGIDLLQGPKITRWSLKSEDLNSDSQILKQKSNKLGQIIEGKRHTQNGGQLMWGMVEPLSAPEVDILPFMTDWSNSEVHPADTLEEGCFLESVTLFHPMPEEVMPVFDSLGIDVEIRQGNEERIEIEVSSPKGVTFIS